MNRPSSKPQGATRSIGISILGGLVLLLLAVTIFAVASQARNVSTQAERAVQTGETLRVVSVARAELSIASRVATLAPEETLIAESSTDNAIEALDAVEANFLGEDLDLSIPEDTQEAFANFRSAAEAQALQITESPDDAEAAQQAELLTGEAFTALFEELRADQEAGIAELEADNDLMNLIATAATFIVAFVVPSAGIIIFQALRNAPRELRRLRLEHDRLDARSQTMATAVSREASKLREDLFNGPRKIDAEVVSRSLLRFESISAFNGADTSIRNEPMKVNDVVCQVVDQIDPKSLVKVERASNWHAFADREQFGLVVSELVSNALTHGSTPIRTTVQSEGDLVALHVIDSGPGLDDEIVAAVIDEERLELRDDIDSGGYGLGLIAARRSLQAMGGTLRYEREQGKTHFIASLPLAPAESDQKPSSVGDGEIPRAA